MSGDTQYGIQCDKFTEWLEFPHETVSWRWLRWSLAWLTAKGIDVFGAANKFGCGKHRVIKRTIPATPEEPRRDE